MRSSLRVLALLLVGAVLAGCGSRIDPESLEGAAATATVTTATGTPGTQSPGTGTPDTQTPDTRPTTPGAAPSPTAARVPSPTATRVPAPPPAALPRRALDLVGRWSVSGPEVPPGTALVIGNEIAVFLPCGVLDADWDASGEQGLFLAASSSGDSSCFRGERYPLPWLEGATGFDLDGEQRRLLAPDGRTLALLTPGARPTTGPDRSEVFAQEPEVTPALRARLAEPPPLPAEEAAPTAAQLRGRWVPVGTFTSEPFVRFDTDGSYTGSDGCNGQSGRYVLGAEGRLLGTGGAQTLIGCDGAPAGGWVAQAARAGLLDGELVLHAPDGAVLGRLSRG